MKMPKGIFIVNFKISFQINTLTEIACGIVKSGSSRIFFKDRYIERISNMGADCLKAPDTMNVAAPIQGAPSGVFKYRYSKYD